MSQNEVHLREIYIYPIKSLPGIPLKKAVLLESGALKGDRRWALFDQSGGVFNAKRSPLLHFVHFTTPNPESWELKWKEEPSEIFDLNSDLPKIENWFSEHLKTQIQLKENSIHGFPDDLEAKGPTLLSFQSLEKVCSWFPDLTLQECLKRFRANLILDAPIPFWEDRLVGKTGQAVSFKIGELKFEGLKVCQRCVVPSRDSKSGSSSSKFIQTFKNKREGTLPDWAEKSRFDHFYRLAINTHLTSNQKDLHIRVGDSLKID